MELSSNLALSSKTNAMELIEQTINGTIPIHIVKVEIEGKWVAFIKDPNFEELSGCIIQADSEAEIEKELLTSIRVMLMYYHGESVKANKLSIWRSNSSRSQTWFTIIGIGLMFYWRPKNLPFKPPKGGLWLGRLRITTINYWSSKD